MQKLRIITIVIFIASCFACTPLQVIQAPSNSEEIGYCRPVAFELTSASNVILYEGLYNKIKQKLQAYIDDKDMWEHYDKEVKLSITMTHIETPSIFDTTLAGPSTLLVPPSKMVGEVVVYHHNKKIGRYPVEARGRTFWPKMLFVNHEDSITEQFVRQIIDGLR
ncbi:MAG: hypothetical protein ABFD75_07300 [Smithella sp.]